MKHRTMFLCAALLAISALSVSGCSETKATPGRTVSTKNTEQDEIKRIQNDPRLPPQAKAAAIKGLQDGQKAAKMAQKVQP